MSRHKLLTACFGLLIVVIFLIASGHSARAACGSTYKVAAGDSWYGIASKCGTTFSALKSENQELWKIRGVNLRIGDILNIPNVPQMTPTTGISATMTPTPPATATLGPATATPTTRATPDFGPTVTVVPHEGGGGAAPQAIEATRRAEAWKQIGTDPVTGQPMSMVSYMDGGFTALALLALVEPSPFGEGIVGGIYIGSRLWKSVKIAAAGLTAYQGWAALEEAVKRAQPTPTFTPTPVKEQCPASVNPEVSGYGHAKNTRTKTEWEEGKDVIAKYGLYRLGYWHDQDVRHALKSCWISNSTTTSGGYVAVMQRLQNPNDPDSVAAGFISRTFVITDNPIWECTKMSNPIYYQEPPKMCVYNR